jgi:hypothetical protein
LIFPEQKTARFNRNITLGVRKIEIFAGPHCKLNEKTIYTGRILIGSKCYGWPWLKEKSFQTS